MLVPCAILTVSKNTLGFKYELEGYRCKQLLKDSYSNCTLTLKVNTLSLICSFKKKPLKTEKVNETAQSTIQNDQNFKFFYHNILKACECKKVEFSTFLS